MIYISETIFKLGSIKNKYKVIILSLIDISLIIVSIVLAFFFRYDKQNLNQLLIEYSIFNYLYLSSTIFIFWLSGFYYIITRYTISVFIYNLFLRNVFSYLLIYFTSKLFDIPLPDNKIGLLLILFTSILIGSSRYLIRDILNFAVSSKKEFKKKVAILGAGPTGAQLAFSLLKNKKYKLECFIEDDIQLVNRTLYQIPILSSEVLNNNKLKVDLVLIANPIISNAQKSLLIKKLQQNSYSFLKVPELDDITSGGFNIEKLKPISGDEFLGREKIVFDPNNLKDNFRSKSICVTGGGGSIGSELCNQILDMQPKKLIIIERSEPCLYKVERLLSNKNNDKTILKFILGSTLDERLMTNLFIDEKINIVFHAAAYKHVPLVEMNPIDGIKNNVFSTLVICKAASLAKLSNVCLISTDKAVRPTNIMGASKRMAELIVQAYASRSKKNSSGKILTKFSMVRFGNVLGSSGSVVPLFQKQIELGGPVTITHPEVIRYFMTISEAVSLVIESTLYAKSGDVFLLEMGNSVKINDLAIQMIKANGLIPKNEEYPNGDIEIKYIGLRPGEKLFEELIIEADAQSTPNKQIYRAMEGFITYAELLPKIKLLENYINERNREKTLDLLKELVPEWKPFSK